MPRVVGFPPVTENRCYDPHPNFVGWQQIQNNARKCNLPADLYPEPYPIIKLEKKHYAHLHAPAEGQVPILAGSGRQVKECDHVRVLGYYVLDHPHAMYSSDCLHGERHVNPLRLTCLPHAELHPYLADPRTNEIDPVTELQPGSQNIQRLSVFLPFYNRFYEYDDYHGLMGIGNRVVDSSKITSSNVEWFIEAPPPPADNCLGACELHVHEQIIKKQGQVQVEIIKETNGARVIVRASADNSADYVYASAEHYLVSNPTIYQAVFGVYWKPKQPTLDIEPRTISAKTPTNIIVHATDKVTGDPVSGRIMINDREVGMTNMPFEYTFDSKNYGTAKVIAPGYSETPISFTISNPLQVRAEPSTIEINRETQLTIYAADTVTHEPVAGKVVILGRPGLLEEQEIGDTNTPFGHTFQPVPNPIRCTGGIHYSYPEVSVKASGYDSAKVRIDFTGSLPPDEPGDSNICIPPDGDDIEDGDNCPNPRRCPIDDDISDGPPPFDLP
jgi:hypothetical protein